MAKKSGLGRGLDSLIPQKSSAKSGAKKSAASAVASTKKNKASEGLFNVDINKIHPNPHQPRSEFIHQELEELISSVKEHGVLQPLVVTARNSEYELIAGERRWRAAKMANLKTVPVIVRQVKQQQKLELALVENIQRQNLNPLEEARAYQKLIDEFGLKQEQVARKVGKSRSVIANSLRLLNLPEEIKKAITNGKITAGHAKIIAGLRNSKEQLKFFKKILKEGLSVRQTESDYKKVAVKKHFRKVDPNLRAQEEELERLLGTKVSIKKKAAGGQIIIEYYSAEELKELLNKLK